ncbi:MAG: PD40 domain-containing protein [Fimbriimonadaceae bacterium]|nr:PD40 domain-containing protein [Fimbriimonadaceae bacterium]
MVLFGALALVVASSPWRVAYSQAGAIWTVGFDGKPPTRIVAKVSWERPLAASPDGTRLVYWDHAQGHWDLWICGSRGQNPRNLTPDMNGGCRSAAFSPDGRTIAFLCDDPPGLYTMALDGSGKKRLSAEGHRDDPPAWSPDGGRLAFHSLADSGPNVFVAEAATGKVTTVGRGSRPDWTKDGKALVVARNGGIGRLGLDGKFARGWEGRPGESYEVLGVVPDGRVAWRSWPDERIGLCSLQTGKSEGVGRYGRNLALFAATADGRAWAAYGKDTLWWSVGSAKGERKLLGVGGIAFVRG